MLALVAFSLLAADTTVVVVRHAEKATFGAPDPELSEAGVARAKALADVMAPMKPVAVLSTKFKRTRNTAAPTAAKLGLEVQVLEGKFEEEILAKYRGKTVLVVGHSNTVPQLVAALGAPRPKDLCEGEFDDLFVVRVPEKGAASVEAKEYGAKTVDDSCRSGSAESRK